jgi:hypothetical protein
MEKDAQMKTSQVSLATLSAFALLHVLTPLSAVADDTTRNIEVSSKEYRYDKPYVESVAIGKNLQNSNSAQATSDTHQTDGVTANIDKSARHEKHMGVSKAASDIVVSSINEFWIYDTWVTLNNDIDSDGYHSTFTVEFDADTIFTQAPVYAVLYIGRNDVYDAIHVSSEFLIFGEETTDSFTIESTLVSGFPTRDYDVLLELYDADTETLVAYSDSYDNANFSLLPLESENNEFVVQDTVVIVEERGGSTSLITILCLGLAIAGRRLLGKTVSSAN